LQGVGFLFYFILKNIGLGIHKGIKQKNLLEERGTPSHQGGVFFHANQQKLYHKRTIQHAIFGWFVNARSTDRPTDPRTNQTNNHQLRHWVNTHHVQKEVNEI
jgi:hypothetical protein